MTRMRIALPATTAIASLLGAALPAFAQAPAPAPMYAPAPAPAPMMAPAPAPEPAAVMPVAPVMAPQAADDMTGSLGFGTGVIAGTSLATIDGSVFMKYWLSDAMSIVPRLSLTMSKAKVPPATEAGDATWGFQPSVLANFVLLKGASTRLDAGVGLGLSLAKNQAPATAGSTDTYIGLFIPVQMGVEHFFTRWFSMGVATGFSFFSFAKQGDAWAMNLEISNVNSIGSLTFYTD
jgi:hypothetical protein